MEFSRLVETRRSVRSFTAEPVADEDLQRILETVRTAPTAGNLQAYRVVVVTDPEVKKKLVQFSGGQESLAQAPVVLGFIALREQSASRYGSRGRELYALQDATIATTYAMLATADVGLATVWVGAFDTLLVAEALECGPGELPVAMLPIGHAAESPEPTPRREMREFVRMIGAKGT
jgi:nitroreductase